VRARMAEVGAGFSLLDPKVSRIRCRQHRERGTLCHGWVSELSILCPLLMELVLCGWQ
jgi:hypothetical protein